MAKLDVCETMKLEDAIKIEGNPFYIPDCTRDDLPQFLKDMGLITGVEVGVYKARFTRKLAACGLKVYGIDPFSAYEGWQAGWSSKRQKRLDYLYAHSRRALAGYENVVLIRKRSVDAAQDFPDDCLDFAYIDGNHAFPYVAEDLWWWHRKVKSGGIVAGHDWPDDNDDEKLPYVRHVPSIMRAWVHVANIKNWYILGRDNPAPNERREPWRSWMYVRP